MSTDSGIRPSARLPSGIVQLARHIEHGRGVGAVAASLETEFLAQGVAVERVTLKTLRLERVSKFASRLSPELGQLVEVVLYSAIAPLAWRLRFRNRYVAISHNDCIFGEIYVNHGVHKAVVFPAQGAWRSRMMFHPLHAFLLLREHLRFSLNAHTAIVNFSKAGEAELVRYQHVRAPVTAVIPNGVNLARFGPRPADREAMRRALEVESHESMAVFVGHEFVRKGLDVAIEAIRRVDPAVRLFVVGGSARMIATARKSAAGLEGRVTFLGQRAQDLPAIYAASDFLVLPSAQEAWPLVLLEAMACGVPCISTPISSVPELITDGVNGMLADRTPAAFATAMSLLHAEPELREKLGAAALETAQQYSWNRIATMYLDLVREIA